MEKQIPQNLSTLTTSSNTPANATSKAIPSARSDTTSPPNINITPLTSTHPSSTLHAFTNNTGPSPSHTPTQSPLSPGQATKPSASNDTTSPPSVTVAPLTSMHPISTLHTFTTGITEGPCQYNVTKSVNKAIAYVVNINSSENQTYTISIKHKHNDIHVQHISNKTAFEIPFEWLRPCTVYTVSVDDCTANGSNTFTSSTKGQTVPQTVVARLTENEVCLKGEFTDIQWNLTDCVKITEQNSCTSTHTIKLDTCTYTMNVEMPPVKPKIRFNTTIPSEFEWTNKPAQCNTSSLNVVCTPDSEKNTYGLNVEVSLLPKKHYTCTGEYLYDKQPIKSDPLSIEIECDLEKNTNVTDRSSNSINMYWKAPENDNCSNIIWDSYSVTCQTSEKRAPKSTCTQDKDDSTHCTITELEPFTIYTCTIIALLDGHEYTIFSRQQKTLSAKPKLKSIKVQQPSHNSVHIQCSNLTGPNEWNGGAGNFEAKIKYNGDPVKTSERKSTCWFSFSDLHYLTTYDIEVTATNKENNWTVIHETITTSYNDKAVVGFLAFLVILMAVALLFVVFKIYLRKRKRDDEDVYEECEYVNVPMRLHRK
ncbi:hypothetical protein Q8A67_006027 [Cirrhinus molitorella]|uniref:Fibronectin type-III domain-containing protein n=1 Tax=Cirrhinus molitorella TaxID=172907 RepID=A0AA88TSD6_9TELE|nr:hypothetical protein Q8A67_006027 [Cirrhinus molitorella]